LHFFCHFLEKKMGHISSSAELTTTITPLLKARQ